MSYTRGFVYGLALGLPLGAGICLGIVTLRRELRLRSERGNEDGPFIDGVHRPDTMVSDWTLTTEGSSGPNSLESEVPDVSAESQRW